MRSQVRQVSAAPTSADFANAGGTPLVVDTLNQSLYAIDVSNSVFPIGTGGGGGGITNIKVSAGTLSTRRSDLTFANSNGVSFGLDTNGVITGTVATNYLTTARGSTDAIGLNTAQSNVTWTVNSSGLSLDARGYAGTGTSATNASVTLNSNGLALSVAAPTVNVSAGTTSNNLGSFVFSNSNGVSFGLNGSTVTATVATNYLTSQSNQALSAANGSFTFQTATFANSNGVSFSTGTQGIFATVQTNYLTTARASTDAIGLNTAQSNVTWTVNSSGLSLDARGYAGTGTSATNASLTLNSNGLAISVAAGGGTTNQTGPSLGVSNLGNTKGSTGTVSTGTVVFVGSNGITLSQSTGAVGSNATITILDAPPISFAILPSPNLLTLVSAPVNASASVVPLFCEDWVSGTRMDMLLYQSLSSSAVGNTYGQQWSIYMGIFTNDSANNRLMSVSSGSTQTTYTVASNTAGNTQLNGSGIRPISCPVNFNMTPGMYFVAVNHVTNTFSSGTASTALNRTVSVVGFPMQSASHAMVADYNVATAATNNSYIPAGVFSAASTGLPGTISYSQFTMTGASRLRANLALVLRG